MKIVDIYTDGSCLKNPGVGGWASILIYKGEEKCICGGEKYTTNNRMELMAVIKGLQALKEKCRVNLYSDSNYVVGAFNNNWLEKWEANGWLSASKSEVLNKDLWVTLSELVCFHEITFIKVKGHSDNEYNNRCDIMARNFATKLQDEMKKSELAEYQEDSDGNSIDDELHNEDSD